LATDAAISERAERLAVELLKAQQRGDPRWVELAQQLAEAARGLAETRVDTPNTSTVARLATELAEQVLVLLEVAAPQTREGRR
jgi:hypothetical protein